MKIITDKKAYVQLNDLAYLCDSSLDVPVSVLREMVGETGLVITSKNRYKCMEFSKKEDIEFFKNQTWMVDYSEVKDKSVEELNKMLVNTAEEAEEYLNEYKRYSEEEQEEHSDILEKYDLLEFKFFSLRYVLWNKKENGKIKLPKTVKGQNIGKNKIFNLKNKNNN